MSHKEITFYTIAYNAEDTISYTIESVLCQTHTNFDYVIRDNASTDKTSEIIRSYAEKDSRIIVIRNEINGVYDSLELLSFEKPSSKYMSILDADDSIDAEFAEIMIAEGEKTNSDIIICGSKMFDDSKYGEFNGMRIPNKFIYKENESSILPEDFKSVYGQLRPLWAKVYNVDFVYESMPKYGEHNWIFDYYNSITRAYDTILSLFLVCNAKCITTVDKGLHYYQIRKTSNFFAYRPEQGRIFDSILIYDMGMEVLRSKKIDEVENIRLLKSVFRGHIEDLLSILRNLRVEDYDFKRNYIQKFFLDIKFKKITQIVKYENIMSLFENIFEEFVQEDKKLDFIDLYIISKQNCSSLINSKLILLGLIFDEKNEYEFGKEEKYIWNSEERIPKWYIEFVARSYEEQKLEIKNLNKLIYDGIDNCSKEEINECKVAMLDLVDNGYLYEALELAQFILSIFPLDRETLYFKCLIAEKLSDIDMVLEVKALIKIYYSTDVEIYELL